MENIKDITGQKFGRLTAIRYTGKRTKCGHNAIWTCLCDCGKTVEATGSDLRLGRKISCGCAKQDRMSMLNRTHGRRNERLYGVWVNMRRRCRDANAACYKDYGGRGISVCDEWQDYETFRQWALENGYDENAEFSKCTLDRIDVNGNYEPNNCRWVDAETQTNNRRSNHVITYMGETLTITQWAKRIGVRTSLLQKRYAAGWSVERMMTKPSQRNAGFKRTSA